MRKFTLFAILSVLAVLSVSCDDSSSGASNADEHAEVISSESAVDEGTSSAEDAILYSSNADDEGSSSNTEEVIESCSSSEATQENMSSEVNESSSPEEASSSSEMESSSSEDVYTVYFGASAPYALYRFNGDTTEAQKAGRFYVVFSNGACKLGTKYDNLTNYGIIYAGKICNNYSIAGDSNRAKDIKLFRSTKDIKKHVLDSLIEGFFNSITVDDTNKIEIEFDPRDWQENVRVCDEEKNCHYETIEKDSVDLTITFWEDVSAERCLEIIESCGAKYVYERSFALHLCSEGFMDVYVTKSSIECLETSRDIMYLDFLQDENLI